MCDSRPIGNNLASFMKNGKNLKKWESRSIEEVPDDAADYSFLVLPKSKSSEEKEKSNIKWPIRTLYTDIDIENCWIKWLYCI